VVFESWRPTVKTKFLWIMFASLLWAADVKLTPEEFVVKPRPPRSWNFQVSSATGRVYGEFRASGGAKNDIRVVIAESSECVNYLNGNRASTFYDSGPKTIGKINVTLRNGEYCIIFDNRNSVVSSKEIAAQIFLQP
jgi:hypothetical protein